MWPPGRRRSSTWRSSSTQRSSPAMPSSWSPALATPTRTCSCRCGAHQRDGALWVVDKDRGSHSLFGAVLIAGRQRDHHDHAHLRRLRSVSTTAPCSKHGLSCHGMALITSDCGQATPAPRTCCTTAGWTTLRVRSSTTATANPHAGPRGNTWTIMPWHGPNHLGLRPKVRSSTTATATTRWPST